MSNTLAKNKGSLPTDPLQALGVSLFLNITSYLPFPTLLAVEQVCRQWREVAKDRERTIWRAACYRAGVEKTQMDTLEMTERAMAQPVWYGEPGEEKEMPSNDAAGIAGWKDICKKHVELDRNWRFGRCRERYLTPPGNSVWRIKVDPENQTLLATDRTGESFVLLTASFADGVRGHYGDRLRYLKTVISDSGSKTFRAPRIRQGLRCL
jgi:hypothetical protein